MVARDIYRWTLLKNAATNPSFRDLAFPMPITKYSSSSSRNLKSYLSSQQNSHRKGPSPLAKEVVYTAAELEPVKAKQAKTVRCYIDDSPYVDASKPVSPPLRRRENQNPRITEVRGKKEPQQQCRTNYKPVRGVSMWFTAV